jgi:hypothetical protein
MNSFVSIFSTSNATQTDLSSVATQPERCVILVPVADQIMPGCEKSLKQLEAWGFPVRRIWGFRDIDVGRSHMATEALAEGFEELMWIDSDIVFEAESVPRLRSHGVPIICGLYAKKGPRSLACQVLPGTPRIEFGENAQLIEVQYAGFGFMLTRRSAYEAVQQQQSLPLCDAGTNRLLVPYFMPLLQPGPEGPWYLAEDYAFCERARRSGLSVLADPGIRLWHIGTTRRSWEEIGGSQARYDRYTFHVQ